MARLLTLLAFVILFILSDHGDNATSILGGALVFALVETFAEPIVRRLWDMAVHGEISGRKK